MTRLRVDCFSISLDGYGAGLCAHPLSAGVDHDGRGTTYHFVTDGIHAALKRATAAANGKDIRLSGGVATIRQYLQAGLIDQLHLAIAPILLGSGEHLLAGIDTRKLGYALTEHVQTAKATHLVLTKQQ
jgi:dihydrofolate reductase